MAKREYLAAMARRYLRAGTRAEKARLLDEICATCRFHRKHALRVLAQARRPTSPRSIKRVGRPALYADGQVRKVLKTIWLTANLPCSKRLKAIVPLWLPSYETSYGALAADVRQAILDISPASIDRLLQRTRLAHTRHGRTTTKPGTLLRNTIPIQTGQWQERRPGFIEADTVAHCGTTTAGTYALTLDCVDIATGWTEQRAVWGKGERGVLEQMRSIEKSLPFALLGFDSDNGSEFINEVLIRHFLSRQRPVQFSRSRAYHKDDNAHVEQKNWTHVRQWLGYDRLDNPAVVPLLNELYTNEWRLFHNFCCPSMKLLEKRRVGSKTIKKHDAPKTPYQRVLESPQISDYAKEGLKRIAANINPFLLRRRIEERIRKIFHQATSSLGNIINEATISA